jgi:hypothetical protein
LDKTLKNPFKRLYIMTLFMVDQKKLIVTMHRDDCRLLSGEMQPELTNGENTGHGNPSVLCEKDLDLQKITQMMEGRYWILALCEECFQ